MVDQSRQKISIKKLRSFDGHGSDVNGVLFFLNKTNQSLLASCSSDKTIRFWTSDEKASKTLSRHNYQVHCLAFASITVDEKQKSIEYMASASTDGTCLLWDLKNCSILKEYRHDSGSPIRVCQFSIDGFLLATAGDDGLINLWDIGATSSRPLKTFSGHTESIVALRFLSDVLVSGSFHGDLKLWLLDSSFTGPVHFQRDAHDLGVTCLDVLIEKNEDQTVKPPSIIASGGNDNLVRIWNCSQKSKSQLTLIRTLKQHSGVVMCVSFGINNILASGSGDKTIIIWNFQTGVSLQQFEAHSRYVTCCAFSFDGLFLATGSNDRMVNYWQIDYNCDLLVQVPQEQFDYQKFPIDQWTNEIVKQWLTKFRINCENKITGHDLLMKSDEEINNLFDGNQQLINELSSLRHEHFMKKLSKHRNKRSSSTNDLKTVEIPNEFLCPITQEIMINPVCASDGYTYEKKAIEEWLKKKQTSPIMNVVVKEMQLYPNKVLKMLIDKYLQKDSK